MGTLNKGVRTLLQTLALFSYCYLIVVNQYVYEFAPKKITKKKRNDVCGKMIKVKGKNESAARRGLN